MQIRLNRRAGVGINAGPREPRLDLQPGVNEVSDADWNRVKDLTFTKILLREGDIEVVGEKAAEPTVPDELPETLSELKASEAVALVEQVEDLEVLERWQEADDRKGVSAAIEKRVNALLQE